MACWVSSLEFWVLRVESVNYVFDISGQERGKGKPSFRITCYHAESRRECSSISRAITLPTGMVITGVIFVI